MTEVRFHLRAAQADGDGYYYTRWDQATPVEVIAKTKQEAINKADKILGPARAGQYWTFIVDQISETVTK